VSALCNSDSLTRSWIGGTVVGAELSRSEPMVLPHAVCDDEE